MSIEHINRCLKIRLVKMVIIVKLYEYSLILLEKSLMNQ